MVGEATSIYPHNALDIDSELKKYQSNYPTCWMNRSEKQFTVHRIELQPNSKQIVQNPYRANPKRLQLEKDETDKILKE